MFDRLYPYQERVLEALMEQKNVILVVPTGGGKTYASCLPFFQNRAFADGLLPETALYVSPMRVLATQFLATAEHLRAALNPELFQEIEARYQKFHQALLSLQTGEAPEDPQFEAMVTATTIDQFLSSALGIPYGLSGKKANLNVAATYSSYLILDEPHLYPVSEDRKNYKGALTTCLELLRLQKGLTRFILMSATLPSALVKRLRLMLGAQVIQLDDAELRELNKGRRRVFECANTSMSAKEILEQHDRCSLVVCNTVQRAQEMYLELWETIEQQGRAIELHLLHSRFTDQDRKRQGTMLGELLGKDQWKGGIYQGRKSVIVVSTQVVEVGLDISVQTLHSEIAPANSLVQRAGRCARFELCQGRVIVYPPALSEQGKPASTRPYASELCKATWQALEPLSGQVIGFREEQQLLDLVHTADDMALLDRYEAHRSDLQQDITACLQTSERGIGRNLIRDVTQIQLAIHNQPEKDMRIKPWRWQSFGLYPHAFLGEHWKRLKACQALHDLDWMCKQPVLGKSEEREQDAEEDQRRVALYEWEHISNPHEIAGALMIVMPHQLVTYDHELGLVFLDGRLPLSEKWQQRLKAHPYQSALHSYLSGKHERVPTRRQSYEQHIGGLADAYHYALSHEIAYTMKHLEQAMGLCGGTIDQAIQLAIAMHDLGKLDQEWQAWARAWQRLLYEKGQWAAPYKEPGQTFFFAKTDHDYFSLDQREWQKELSVKRPNHACESVRASRSLLMHSLGVNCPHHPNEPVVRAICAAIAHHHTPTASTYGKTKIRPEARNALAKGVEAARRGGKWDADLNRIVLAFEAGDLFPPNVSQGLFTLPTVAAGTEKAFETWLAFLIVRALRLADQRADLYRA